MGRIQYEELACPFCDKGRIACGHVPSVTTIKRTRSATFGSKTERSKSSEIWLIQSGCSVCGKTREEVEKKMKEDGVI